MRPAAPAPESGIRTRFGAKTPARPECAAPRVVYGAPAGSARRKGRRGTRRYAHMSSDGTAAGRPRRKSLKCRFYGTTTPDGSEVSFMTFHGPLADKPSDPAPMKPQFRSGGRNRRHIRFALHSAYRSVSLGSLPGQPEGSDSARGGRDRHARNTRTNSLGGAVSQQSHESRRARLRR